MAKQWTADEILGMGRSYQSACVITAAAELDLFSALEARTMNAESLARRLDCDPRATTILLDALASLGLLTKRDCDYSIPASLAKLLCKSSPNNVIPMLRHTGACLRRWAQLAQVVKSGRSAQRIAGLLDQTAETEAFIGAMNNVSAPVAAEVVARLQPLEFTRLLDVGGASGTWTIEFLKTAPKARATIFDLPDVIPMAKERLTRAGLIDRVELVAGDYYEDDLPAGADLAWLSAIAHQNSRKQNRDLFAKVHAALTEGGHAVIRDIVMHPSRTAPRTGAIFAVNMLVVTPAGGTYTLDEYTEDLQSAGFTGVTLVHRDEFMSSLIRARKS
ncbi:MAG TPA: methyltransferase [Sedimentisphaerales bacterium]|nr:methyltransferase [Sedimentisphaerales bacterium]